VCCGTKRLTQIKCPTDCAYLSVAREHPPAVAVRQRQLDVAFMSRLARDFSRSQLGFLLTACAAVRSHQPALLHPLIDDDVSEAARALAATFETAERGVIYEHRPASLPAERLMNDLKLAFAEVRKHSTVSIGGEAALALRRIEEAIRELHQREPANRRVFLDFIGRVVPAEGAPSGSRLPDPGVRSSPVVLIDGEG
jgi:hypothetical protein